MGCEDDHSMSKTLQADSCIDHKTLGTAYTKVGVEKDDCLRRCRHFTKKDHFPKAFNDMAAGRVFPAVGDQIANSALGLW